MIGGIECILTAPPLDEAFEAIVQLCRRRWQGGVFLDADEMSLLPLVGPELAWRPPSQEFFVFSDRLTAERWDDLGPCKENWNRMIHFLCRAHEGGTRVTVIVDEITPDVSRFLQDLQATFHEYRLFGEAVGPS